MIIQKNNDLYYVLFSGQETLEIKPDFYQMTMGADINLFRYNGPIPISEIEQYAVTDVNTTSTNISDLRMVDTFYSMTFGFTVGIEYTVQKPVNDEVPLNFTVIIPIDVLQENVLMELLSKEQVPPYRLPGKDMWGKIEIPDYILTKASGEQIGIIPCIDKSKKYIRKFNQYDEIEFVTYKNINEEPNPIYDSILELQYVTVPSIGEFIINSIDTEIEDETNEKKSVTAISSEVCLAQKYLEEFHINTGETGSIDNVSLLNIENTSLSLLHLILEKCPEWKIGHVDIALGSKQRFFEVDRTDVYTFLTDEIEHAFECVVLFNTLEHTINVYSEDTVGEDTNVYISFNNLASKVELSSSIDDIKTCLTVTGSEDVDLRQVNLGMDRIYNFDYFMSEEYMSQDLINALKAWKQKRDNAKPTYAELLEIYNQCFEDIAHWESNKVGSTTEEEISNDYYQNVLANVNQLIEETFGNGSLSPEAGVNLWDETKVENRYFSSVNHQWVQSDDYRSLLLKADAYTTYRVFGFTGTLRYVIIGQNEELLEVAGQEVGAVTEPKVITIPYYGAGAVPQWIIFYINKDDYNPNEIGIYSGEEIYLNEEIIGQISAVLPDGLAELKTALSAKQQQVTNAMNAGFGTISSSNKVDDAESDYNTHYLPYYLEQQALKDLVKIVQVIIDFYKNKQDIIGRQMNELQASVAIENNLTYSQGVELSRFIREDELASENYVVTDTMTAEQRLEMLNDMLSFGEKELAKVAQPTLGFSVDMANLFAIPELDPMSEKFDTGNYIHVVLRDDYIIKARILVINFDFYDVGDFSSDFGNVMRLTPKGMLQDITEALDQAQSAATSVSFNSSIWNQANKEATSIATRIENGLSEAGLSLTNASSSIEVDERGMFVNNTSQSEYAGDSIYIGDGKILFSDDKFKTIQTALGRIKYENAEGQLIDTFGLIAQAVLAGYIEGSTIVGSNIIAKNNQGDTIFNLNAEDGTLDIHANSLTFTPLNIGDGQDMTVEQAIAQLGEELQNNLSDIVSSSSGQIEGLKNCIEIDSDGNLVIKAQGSGNDGVQFKAVFSSVGLTFYYGDEPISHFSNSDFSINNGTVVNKMTIGDFQWQVRRTSSGKNNLSLIYIGSDY